MRISNVLLLDVIVSSANTYDFEKLIRSTPFKSHSFQIYHTSLDTNHKIELEVKTERIITKSNTIPFKNG